MVASPYRSGGMRGHHGFVPSARRWLADLAGGFLLLAAAVSVVTGLASGLGWAELLEGFVVSNTINGLALGLAGFTIARSRPGNAVGWLLLAAGVAYSLSGVGYALLAWGTTPGQDSPGWRLLADATSLGWPLAVSLLIPMALLVFPDGRLPGRWWRLVVGFALVATCGFLALMVLGPQDTTTGVGVDGYLRVGALDGLSWLPTVVGLMTLGVYGAALASLVVRYRRAGDTVRRQLLWVLLAALVMITVSVVEAVLGAETWAGIFVIVLPPAAIMIAILRDQLLDIQLVVSRYVLYLVLTGLAVASYVLIVLVTERSLADRVPLGPPVLAALVIALCFNPLRQVLQGRIERLFYGARRDPVRAAAEVGEHLGEIGAADTTGLTELLATICRVLRLPWASLEAGGSTMAVAGTPHDRGHSVALRLGGEDVGQLTVGVRPGESHLGSSDVATLGLLSTSVAVAVHATTLADELGEARSAMVTAREQERRRLSRDLHDGLGPLLTGVILKADAARRLVPTAPEDAEELMLDVRDRTADAVAEIRRLVRELRPPALDQMSLPAALREYAASAGPLAVTVTSPADLPDLEPAVEVALYRIATEALTNVVRHSPATGASVALRTTADSVALDIRDNGGASDGPWAAGVGLASMRERAIELGGTFSAGPDATGGSVRVTIPCGPTH